MKCFKIYLSHCISIICILFSFWGTNLGIRDSKQTKMNHTEAIREIVEVIPETQEEFDESYKTASSYMVINVFTKQIKKLIKNNDQKILKKCIRKMNKLYSKGDQKLQGAIENVFVYSIDSFTFCCEPAYKKMIFDKMSVSLQNNYLHQVYKSGI